jgi:hypothetical protein
MCCRHRCSPTLVAKLTRIQRVDVDTQIHLLVPDLVHDLVHYSLHNLVYTDTVDLACSYVREAAVYTVLQIVILAEQHSARV